MEDWKTELYYPTIQDAIKASQIATDFAERMINRLPPDDHEQFLCQNCNDAARMFYSSVKKNNSYTKDAIDLESATIFANITIQTAINAANEASMSIEHFKYGKCDFMNPKAYRNRELLMLLIKN